MANEDKKDFNAMLQDNKDMPKFQIITDVKSIEKYGGNKMYFAPPIAYDEVMKKIPYGKVITVGKIKEKYLRDAIGEYSKRLSKYCKLEIIEVADEKTPERASEVVEESIRSKEGERILKYIKEDAYVITLEIGGKQLASEELADKIEQLGIQGKSQIVFIIGGSIGLGKEVLKKSNYALSFSKMTFPHQLMRVILLEQI